MLQNQLYFDKFSCSLFNNKKKTCYNKQNTNIIQIQRLPKFTTKKPLYSSIYNNSNKPILGCKPIAQTKISKS